MHPNDLPRIEAAMLDHLSDPAQPYRVEYRMRHRRGDWIWVMSAGAVVERGTAQEPLRLAGIHMDINSRKHLEQALSTAALTDTLTGLPNRAALLERLNTGLARLRTEPNEHIALMFLDFDKFKQVNDQFGHDVGDELLRQVAERLRLVLRPSDDVARLDRSNGTAAPARLGGDEFVVLLEQLGSPGQALSVATRVATALAAPYLLGRHRVDSSASIGLSVCGGVAGDAALTLPDSDALLRRADRAMYVAKERGRGLIVVWQPALDLDEPHRAPTRHCVVVPMPMSMSMSMSMSAAGDPDPASPARPSAMPGALRDAIETGEQFTVRYQPVIDLQTDRWMSLKTVPMWHHPALGWLAVLDYAPMLTQGGLLPELARRVLGVASRDLALLIDRHGERSPAAVSIEVGADAMRDVAFCEAVRHASAHLELPTGALCLDLRESLVTDEPGIATTLEALHAAGVSLCLTGFGSGRASLAVLDSLPFAAVQIDASFVRGVATDRYRQALVSATCRMADALGQAVIAMGVDSEVDLAALPGLGCQLVVGLAKAKAMDIGELDVHLRLPGVASLSVH